MEDLPVSSTPFSKFLIVFATAAFTATAGVATMAYAQEKKATTTPKAPVAKTPSVCKGVSEAACKEKTTECTWVKASKDKNGKERKAYCRAKPAPKAK
jgi:hypothetical protein